MISEIFNLEEISLIHACQSGKRDALVMELHRHRESAGPDMAEIIDRTIHKLSGITSSQLQEILDYPVENEGV